MVGPLALRLALSGSCAPCRTAAVENSRQDATGFSATTVNHHPQLEAQARSELECAWTAGAEHRIQPACRLSKSKFTYIYSGDKKVDANSHEPLSSGARADLRAQVDTIRDIFVETVARNRNVDPKDIYNTEAATYMGADGVPLLADQVGTLVDALRLAGMSEAERSLTQARAKLARLRGDATPGGYQNEIARHIAAYRNW
jgi:hypothetical protein